MAIAIIDEKGRIQIPEKIREELYLKPGEELEIKKEGKKITLLPLISPEAVSYTHLTLPTNREV